MSPFSDLNCFTSKSVKHYCQFISRPRLGAEWTVNGKLLYCTKCSIPGSAPVFKKQSFRMWGSLHRGQVWWVNSCVGVSPANFMQAAYPCQRAAVIRMPCWKLHHCYDRGVMWVTRQVDTKNNQSFGEIPGMLHMTSEPGTWTPWARSTDTATLS